MRTLASIALVFVVASVSAAQTLTAFPAKLAIRGADDAPQLLLTAKTPARELDATAKAKYAVANASICRVDETGPRLPARQRSTRSSRPSRARA